MNQAEFILETIRQKHLQREREKRESAVRRQEAIRHKNERREAKLAYRNVPLYPNINPPTQLQQGQQRYRQLKDELVQLYRVPYGSRTIIQDHRIHEIKNELSRTPYIRETEQYRRPLLHEASDGKVRLGVNDTWKHFRGITESERVNARNRYSSPITILDSETGKNNQPISVSAVKGVMDLQTGEFRVIDTFERYYSPKDPSSAAFNLSREVHGLTPRKIAQLRSLQGAQYGASWDDLERTDLRRFVGQSLLVGQNTDEFDYRALGLESDMYTQPVLDTLVAAENMGIRKGRRDLESLYKQFTGANFKQNGYSHHISFHDVLMTAEVLSGMYRSNTLTGRDIRYIIQNEGFSLGRYRELQAQAVDGKGNIVRNQFGTGVFHGGFGELYGSGGFGNYMFEGMDNGEWSEEYGLDREFDENNNMVLPNGFHYDDDESGYDAGNTNYGIGASTNWERLFGSLQSAVQQAGNSLAGYNMTKAKQYEGTIRKMLAAGASRKDIETYLQRHKFSGETVNNLIEAAQLVNDSVELDDWGALSDAISYNQYTGAITGDQALVLSSMHQAGSSRREVKNAFRRMRYDTAENNRRIKDEEREEEQYAEEQHRKRRYLQKLVRNGDLTDEQASLIDLSDSFEDLSDATEEIIKKNRELQDVYTAIGNIKMYDPAQYWNAMKTQARGVISSAQGVVPNFIRQPFGRLESAFENFGDRRLAPWSAMQRVWGSGIGDVVSSGVALTGTGIGATLGTILAPGIGTGVGAIVGSAAGGIVGKGIKGGVNALTQLQGNSEQAALEMKGLEIQNTLNTLGATVSWITTPFKLLHKAIKTVIGSFGGLTTALRNIISGGIGEMTQMGNPLQDLTGLNYEGYQGAGMMDVASLFNKGSMNSIYEDFANQARGLYTTGDLSIERVRAASMLGIFDKVYSPTANADTYNSMVNDLLRKMSGQDSQGRAQTMYLASQIDRNLPGLLRTAQMLNISDVNQLMDPTSRGMYWRPISSTKVNGVSEEEQFRWTQYEYGAFKEQWGNTKKRFANRLWNSGGKEVFNSFNSIMDAAAGGDWTAAINAATEAWGKLKEKFDDVWTTVKANIDGGKIKDGLKNIVQGVAGAMVSISKLIINAWADITKALIDKLQGLAGYLSGFSFGAKLGKDGNLHFQIHTPEEQWEKDIAKSDQQGGRLYRHDPKGERGPMPLHNNSLIELYKALGGTDYTHATKDSIRALLQQKKGTWTEDGDGNNGNWLTFAGDGTRWAPNTDEAIEELLAYASIDKDKPMLRDGFKFRHTGSFSKIDREYSDTLPNMVNPLIDSMTQIATDVLSNTSQKLEINFKVNGKSGAKMVLDKGKVIEEKGMTWLNQIFAKGLDNEITLQMSAQR